MRGQLSAEEPRFTSLPPELIWRICRKLQNDSIHERIGYSLLPLAKTCKNMYELASPLAWSSLQVIFKRSDHDDQRILQDLHSLISQAGHPAFRFARSITIVLPYYNAATSDTFFEQLDQVLDPLLIRLAALQTVVLDLSMISHPLVRLKRTFQTLADTKVDFKTMTILGLVTDDRFCARHNVNLTSFRGEAIKMVFPLISLVSRICAAYGSALTAGTTKSLPRHQACTSLRRCGQILKLSCWSYMAGRNTQRWLRKP